MPPLAGPRLMLCWTRQPVKTWTEPSSIRTGKWTVSSRLTSRRPARASSERPITSAAASKRRCAVWKAEARISTAIRRLPIVTPGSQTGYLVNFQDAQDIVNLLFAQGAEGVAVNGRRITPLTAFSGSVGQIVIDQGTPVSSPITISAIGDRNRMQEALDDPSALPDIRARQLQFQLHLTFQGRADISLPAYDSSLRIPNASPA